MKLTGKSVVRKKKGYKTKKENGGKKEKAGRRARERQYFFN